LVRKATEEVTVFSGKLDATEKESYDWPENTRRSTWNVESVVYYQSMKKVAILVLML
jgi:hypothetical protein